MACIILDVEFADKKVFEELGVFFVVKFQGYSFRPPKKYKPTTQTALCTGNLHTTVWNSGRLDYIELLDIIPKDVKGE